MGIKLTHMIAVLTGSSQNLFNESWTEGNLYEIQPVVNVLGGLALKVISFVGFAIVIFSILKNALSALYVISPNIWDKVDALKKQASDSGFGMKNSSNAAFQKVGSVMAMILGILPNIKELTDFADGKDGSEGKDINTINKTQFFTKCLLALVVQIFIGMMIFYGYPAKIANWVGTAGTTVLSGILNNADPQAVINSWSDKFITVTLSTDDTTDKVEKQINTMARDAVKIVNTKYSDIHKDTLQSIALNIESQLISMLGVPDITDVLGAAEGYTVSANVNFYTMQPQFSAAYNPVEGTSVYMALATNGTRSYKFSINCGALNTGSLKVGASDHIVFTITATPVSVSAAYTSSLISFAGYTGSEDGIDTSKKTGSIMIQGIQFGNDVQTLSGKMGQSVYVDVIDKSTGLIAKSYTLKIELPSESMGNTNSANALLVGTDTQISSILGDLGTDGSKYLRVTFTTPFNKHLTMKDTNGTEVRSDVKVAELRLFKDRATASWALSSWNDVSLTTTDGRVLDDGTAFDFMNRGKLGE